MKSIGVLCGGPSTEREISIRSGQAVHEALRSLGLPSALVILSADPERIPDEIRSAGIGCAFIALHGCFGEDGAVQSLLERMGIPYTGSSVEACRYGMDKLFSRRRWAAEGLPVPHWRLADPSGLIADAKFLGFPVVVKPRAQGSSLGICIVDSPEDLPRAAQEAGRFGADLLVEEYLAGPELTVGILDGMPLPVLQIVPRRRFYDFVAKYTAGMTEYRVPAPLPESDRLAAQDLALRAHEALGCRSFSRVDMILVEGRGPVLLELNPVPGMTPASLLPKAAAAAGIPFPELCRRMLASALEQTPAPAGRVN